jgi:uncharacterized membrane protein (DUF373 family)
MTESHKESSTAHSTQEYSAAHPTRARVIKGLVLVEDVVYVGLGVLLAISAIALLVAGFESFIAALAHHSLPEQFISLLDQMLQVLLVVELLYTVQVSFREHGLVTEPFFVVTLIAVIRKILVLSAKLTELPEGNETAFHHAVIDMVMFAGLIVVLVGALILLQKHGRRE